MSEERLEGDQDSLFGSPPASPRPSRTPSPGLALPNAITGAAKQNVGTIALPGSHNFSEFPMNLLAPSPPSMTAVQVGQDRLASPSSSSKSTITPPEKSRRKKKAIPKRSQDIPRSRLQEIHLPDPSHPPPPDFLKNQSALLGTAGLVAGIKPLQLATHLYTRGNDSKNPIVIEDEVHQMTTPDSFKSRTVPKFHPSAQHSSPPLKDIISVLMSQKDLAPVLQSFIKLLSSGAALRSDEISSTPIPTTGKILFQPHGSSQNYLKKRRLNRVPAGAVDWDVPFPFAYGEGPEHYEKNWERERIKQLWLQLVDLIKTSARTAAARASLQAEKENRVVVKPTMIHKGTLTKPEIFCGDLGVTNKQHLPISGHGGGSSSSAPNESGCDVAVKEQTTMHQTATIDLFNYPALPSMVSPPFESIGDQATLQSAPPPPTSMEPISPSLSTPQNSTGNRDYVEMDAFDDWMTLFQMIPDLSETHKTMPMDFSHPNTIETEEDFGYLDALDNFPPQHGIDLLQPISDVDETLILRRPFPIVSDAQGDEASCSDKLDHHEGQTQTTDANRNETCIRDADKCSEQCQTEENEDSRIDDLVLQAPFTANSDPPPAQPSPKSDPLKESVKPLDRGEILNRATKRKKQMQDQVDKVKRRLWETTIEQAILVHMQKQFDST